MPVQYSPRSSHGVPGKQKGRPEADFIQERPEAPGCGSRLCSSPRRAASAPGPTRRAPAGQRLIPHGAAGRVGRPGRPSPSPRPRGAGERPLASGCSSGRQRLGEAAEDGERASAAPPARSYLLRLFSQGDAHGPEARLELGNIHPPIFVEVQLPEEVSVPGVAIPAPVASGRRQREASQELEHGAAVQYRQRGPSAPAGWARTGGTACAAANARSCQRRSRAEPARPGPAPPQRRGGGGGGGGGGGRGGRAGRRGALRREAGSEPRREEGGRQPQPLRRASALLPALKTVVSS